MWYNIEKAEESISMNNKNVILEEYIESYKEVHRIFYTGHNFQSDKFYLHFSSIWHIIL